MNYLPPVLSRWKPQKQTNCFCTCFSCAMWRVMYSTVTGSSTVNLWLWHSILARLIKIRASAVKPAKRTIIRLYMVRFVNSFVMYWLSLVLRQSLHPPPTRPCDPHTTEHSCRWCSFLGTYQINFSALKKKRGRKVMFGTTEKTHYWNSRTSQIKPFSCFNHAYTISDQNSMAKMIHFLRPIPKYVGFANAAVILCLWGCCFLLFLWSSLHPICVLLLELLTVVSIFRHHNCTTTKKCNQPLMK